jgi:hypothetical protein
MKKQANMSNGKKPPFDPTQPYTEYVPDIKKSEKVKKPKFDPTQPYTEVDQEELEPSTFEKIINVFDIPGSVGRTAIEAGLSPEREVIPEVTRQIEAIKERPTTAAMEAPSEYDVFKELVGKPEPKSPEEIAARKKEFPILDPIIRGAEQATGTLAGAAIGTLASGPLGLGTFLARKIIKKPFISMAERQAAKAVSKYANKAKVGAEGVDPSVIGARLVAEDLQGKLRNAPKFYETIAGKRHIQKIRPDSLDTLVIKRGKKEGGLISKTSGEITSMLQSVEKQAPESVVIPADVGLKVIFENIRKKLSATSGETPNIEQIQQYVENALKPFDTKTEVFPGEPFLQKMPGSLELSEQLKTVEKKVPVARKITITQVQELRKNIGKLLSDRDFYATPDKAMAAETEVLRDLYRELGDTIKTKLANVDVKVDGKILNAAEFYEAQNNKLKTYYDIESMLEFTPLKDLQDNDLAQMTFGVLAKGGIVGAAAGGSMLFGLPDYATTGGIIAAGVSGGMSAANTVQKALPEYLTSIFKQAANVAPYTGPITQTGIMLSREGLFQPEQNTFQPGYDFSQTSPAFQTGSPFGFTPKELVEYKIPKNTSDIKLQKHKVLAKLAMADLPEQLLDTVTDVLNGDESDLAEYMPNLIVQLDSIAPNLFDKKYKNGKFLTYDNKFLNDADRALAADTIRKRKDLNSIQRARMINQINEFNVPEGL